MSDNVPYYINVIFSVRTVVYESGKMGKNNEVKGGGGS